MIFRGIRAQIFEDDRDECGGDMLEKSCWQPVSFRLLQQAWPGMTGVRADGSSVISGPAGSCQGQAEHAGDQDRRDGFVPIAHEVTSTNSSDLPRSNSRFRNMRLGYDPKTVRAWKGPLPSFYRIH